MTMAREDVFDAVRRGYDDLEFASEAEITAYFERVEPETVLGHSNHIKGILFEQEYVEVLGETGIEASLFDTTNHPGTDILVFGGIEGETEIQLKATDSINYVTRAMEEDPEITFAVTSEVAARIDSDLVIDTEIENAALESTVSETLFEESISPIGALSLVRFLIGIPF